MIEYLIKKYNMNVTSMIRNGTVAVITMMGVLRLLNGQVHVSGVQLAVRHFLDGQGDGLLRQMLASLLRLVGDLPGPAGHHVHQHIAVGDIAGQLVHCGIQHHNGSTSYLPCRRKFIYGQSGRLSVR